MRWFILYLLILSLHANILAESLPGSKILSSVPDVRQCTDYSCGASALQAILFYWGCEYREMTLVEMLHTSPENGTHPNDILRVAKELEFQVELKETLQIKDLEESIDQGIPVIICCQAWRDEEDKSKPWKEVWESGHYMIVIGYDETQLYFEDPSLLGSRGIIPKAEFLDRWHDYEGDSPLDDADRKYCQAGIFIKGKAISEVPRFMYVE